MSIVTLNLMDRTLTPENVAIYREPSESKQGVYYEAAISLLTGEVDCTCPDYEMRLRPLAVAIGITPHITSARFHCRHIEAAIRDCLKRGDIEFNVPKIGSC